ncbi:hypothetical protein [Streptomyces sp. NPDC007856]|uniref:hypothetical protein n=1 Tax=Streptomyces sp. NPDC007856 TaxID=3364781 RepID=UPI0036C37061
MAAGATATAVSPADAAEASGDQSPASAARTLRAAADHTVEKLHAVAPGLTGDHSWRAGAIEAAESLIQRYNPRGRFIRAWGALNDPNNAGQADDDKCLYIAVEHANTAQRVFPRSDGSTPHVFDFDPDTGAPIGPNTVHGQQWLLSTAGRLADFAVGALSPDHIPVWDYRAPQAPYDIKDASAGAITGRSPCES